MVNSPRLRTLSLCKCRLQILNGEVGTGDLCDRYRGVNPFGEPT
jgi:hypothetical protein